MVNTLYKKAMSSTAECCICKQMVGYGEMIRVNALGDLVCSTLCLGYCQDACPHEPENVTTEDGIARCTACQRILAVDPMRP